MKVWVIGRGGLLGSSVEKECLASAEVYFPAINFNWRDINLVSQDLNACCHNFFGNLGSENWAIYWCAGRGTLASTIDQMENENQIFESLLGSIENTCPTGSRDRGVIFHASSAGSIYGGSQNPPFTELTVPKPLTPYGDAKLRQEHSLREFSKRLGVRVLIGRISNLYGARQDLEKNQGLISTICYSILRRQPIKLFVPLETSRNYIFVKDAAKTIVGLVNTLITLSETEKFKVKLIVAEENLTIGSIINIAKTVFRVKPLVTLSANKTGSAEPQNLVFKSVSQIGSSSNIQTSFSVGIKQVMSELQSGFLAKGWYKSND